MREPLTIQRKPPRTLSGPVDASFEPLLRVQAPERALVSLSGGRVVGGGGLVVLPDGLFVGQLLAITPAGQRSMLSQERGYSAPFPRTPKVMEGRYYLLVGSGWRNYYHWNHDIVMGLHFVRDHLPVDIRFIVPQGLRAYHLDPLSLFGIAESQLVAIPDGEVWQVESLYIAVPINKTQLDSPESPSSFRSRYLDAIGAPTTTPHRRLYVRRGPKDDHYRIANHEQVEACLLGNGFESHYPGDMTVRDQAALFSQARIIVGTGTGLFNMVFAPSGATVVQFQEPSGIVHALWTLSESLGHEYWYVLGDTVANGAGRRPDIHVPVRPLQRTLEKILL